MFIYQISTKYIEQNTGAPQMFEQETPYKVLWTTRANMATPVPQKDDVEHWTVEQVAAWLQQVGLVGSCFIV